MTIEQIQADEALRLREFPVARETAYLAHAAVCPLPACARDAVSDYAAACTGGDQENFVPANLLRDTRQLASNLLGAELCEIALVGPTSLGLSFIAQGIDWQPGDNIIVHGDDYPSNVYPWMALAKKGVELKRLEPSAPGRIEPEDVFELIDSRTRMAALASCHYVSGYRIDIGTIGRELRSRGILFCVDGIQTVGAFPTPVEHVDFLAADAHKWMLGPCSAGILYVKREMQDRLKPVVQGWHNLSCPDFIAQETLDYKPDGRRYEAGTANLLGIVGHHASLQLLDALGLEKIAADLLAKRRLLLPELLAKGCDVLHADVPEANASGIVAFSKPGEDMAALQARLGQAGVTVSLRVMRDGSKLIRLSPHFYNTPAELYRLLEAL
ncbi:MAG: selenocysteine lyase/cysteine desulfurase [Limisphaerales bacterium]|jgi:cysteine desulfurase/selenocysteine lyase|tara:strand:- start:2688 stop:3839 length:1152 start_codon:yes stop_codon:yes gene_type:complete